MRLIIFLIACGTGGDAGGGADNLPASGGGPFSPIEMQMGDLIDAPVVLTDPAVDLDDPDVIANGAALTVWVTAHRSTANGPKDEIDRADAVSLRKGFGDFEVALKADQPWEGSGVSAPSVVPGNPNVLFYWAEGGIGAATSPDLHNWTKVPGPIIANVGPPAAVRIGNSLRVYYVKDGSLFAKEGSLESLTDLGEMVHAVPYGSSIGRAFARAAQTPVGRLRHDLYFTVETGLMTAPTTCGWASSYDGLHFDVFASAITDPKETTSGPTMAPYQVDGVGSALLLWIQRRGARAVVFAGKSP
jgi:hypothetical protein